MLRPSLRWMPETAQAVGRRSIGAASVSLPRDAVIGGHRLDRPQAAAFTEG
jgi:hypothetical protein